MRRIIRNTTAIAACLSLLLPHLAQAQVSAPVRESAGATVPDSAPLLLAQAERQEPPVRQGQAQPAERQRKPQSEQKPQRAGQQAREAKPHQGRGQSKEASSRQAGEQPQRARKPAAQQAGEQPQRERQRPNAAQNRPGRASQPERPAQARAQQEQRAARAKERAEQKKQDKGPRRVEEPARAQRGREEAMRREQAERREQAAREQNRERPAARNQASERPAPRLQRQSERQVPQSPSAMPNDNGRRQQARQLAPVPRNAPDEQTLRDALLREQQQQRNITTRGEGRPQRAGQPVPRQTRSSKADSPPSEAARQAARERRAARAAALNDDQRGRIIEQRITRENSRSSNEDFRTNLRDAMRVRDQQRAEARNNDDDDDNNDLAKALLLGLGAVAVGTYLNNNRQVALSAPDRVVVTRADGSQEVIKDEVALLRQPGSTVSTENFDDGSSRTVVTRADGSRVITIRDADLRVLRRTLVSPDGTQTRLIDDTAEVEPVDIATLPAPAPVYNPGTAGDEAALREALRQEVDVDRRFTLGQIRSIPEVRSLVAPVNIDAITFDSGSAAISPDQAQQLSALGNVIQEAIAENPQEMFLIEGHTDLVGSDTANLALSDRRAESVALALSEYFQVPPENLVVQGYGEQYPQLRQEGDIRENRRASVRRITDLLQTAEAQ